MDITALTLTEFLALPSSPEQWIVSNLLPTQAFVTLWGPPKEGKTLLSVSLALAIAQGQPFLGHDTTQGPVLLLELDTADALFRHMLINCRNAGLPTEGPLYLPDPAQLAAQYPLSLQDSGACWYVHQLVALVKPRLVIVDCFRELYDGDEDKSQFQKPVIAALRAVTTFHPTDPCACLLLHHTRKFRSDETPGVKESGRGSGYLSGAVDSIWFLYQGRLHIQPRFAQAQSIPLVQGAAGIWSRRG